MKRKQGPSTRRGTGEPRTNTARATAIATITITTTTTTTTVTPAPPAQVFPRVILQSTDKSGESGKSKTEERRNTEEEWKINV
mmetsp:Transcript_31704/g.72833  ORF Transcript_31704/g.72833 Transcript_31704/m.72833 type:complete len:83 (+) Transcript_31704:580-828(+)